MSKLTILALLTELVLKLAELADTVGDPEVGDDGRGASFAEVVGGRVAFATYGRVWKLSNRLRRDHGVALGNTALPIAMAKASIGDMIDHVAAILDEAYEGQPQAV